MKYDFAIWLEYRYANRPDITGNEAYTWLEYSSGDRPILYVGGQVRGRVPSDFPILPFNPADTSTYYQTERGQYSTEDMRLVGSCVRRPRYSDYLWGRFVNYTWASSTTQYEYGYYRVDMSKLANTREVMWQLDHVRMGISPPPENHAVVVRYHNRYFLPQCGHDVLPFAHENMFSTGRRLAGIGLLLWCLGHAGIKPRRSVVTWWEIDHPLNSGGYREYTAQQRLYLLRLSTEWLYEFTRFRGIHVTCGITTNHTRDNTWGHYKTLTTFPQEAQPIHDLLVRAEREGRWSMCWHDHSYELGASGVELIPCEDLHLVAQRGLYNPGSGGRDIDLNQQYGLSAASAEQAYRRFMAMQMERFLTLTVYNIGCVYLHDTACTAAGLSTPLARFSENGNWNGYVELFSETDNIVQVLSDWVRWGNPSEMQEYRRWLRAYLGFLPVEWVMQRLVPSYRRQV